MMEETYHVGTQGLPVEPASLRQHFCVCVRVFRGTQRHMTLLAPGRDSQALGPLSSTGAPQEAWAGRAQPGSGLALEVPLPSASDGSQNAGNHATGKGLGLPGFPGLGLRRPPAAT